MRPAKELIGKPIYSITNGRQLGVVKDLFLDEDLTMVKGIYLGQEGLFKRKWLLIPMDRVAVLGEDAVLTTGPEVVTDSNELLEAQRWLRREELHGREVDTPGGTKVGALGDVLVDDAAQIAGFALARAYVAGPVAESRLVPRAAVVDSGSADGAMTVDLTLAEQGPGAIRAAEDTSPVAPPPAVEPPPAEPGEPETGTEEELR